MSPDPAPSTTSAAGPAAPTKPAAKPAAAPAPAPKPAAKPAAQPSKPAAAPAPAAKPVAPAAKTEAKPTPKPAEKKVEAKKVEAKPAGAAPAHKWEKTARSSRPAGPAPKVIDASGLVLGRAASLLAKRLIQGETIAVVNTEHAVVLGHYSSLLEQYRLAVARGSVRKGPHFPRRPDRIFRRTVRGMLPFRHSKGREAWARLATYVGIPEELASLPRETLEGARPRPSLKPPLTLGEISHRVGGVGRW